MKKEENSDFQKRAYAFKIYGRKKRIFCQSGGAFTALAESLVDKGWVVYGVTYEKPYAIYERATTREQLKRFKGSKYVQAKPGNVFHLLEDDLRRDDVNVLFSGTPCMTDAVKKFCKTRGVNTQRLVTVEILCHGVVSPELFKEYVLYSEKNQGFNSKKFIFRDKSINGWGGYWSRFKINSCIDKISKNWLLIFRSDRYLRESCYNCIYACRNRKADITISDFWKIRNVDRQFADVNGISMILFNNEKGKCFIDHFTGKGRMTEVSFDSILQGPMEHPTEYKNDGVNVDWDNKTFEENAKSIIENYKTKDITVFCGIPLTIDKQFWKGFISFNVKSVLANVKGRIK